MTHTRSGEAEGVRRRLACTRSAADAGRLRRSPKSGLPGYAVCQLVRDRLRPPAYRRRRSSPGCTRSSRRSSNSARAAEAVRRGRAPTIVRTSPAEFSGVHRVGIGQMGPRGEGGRHQTGVGSERDGREATSLERSPQTGLKENRVEETFREEAPCRGSHRCRCAPRASLSALDGVRVRDRRRRAGLPDQAGARDHPVPAGRHQRHRRPPDRDRSSPTGWASSSSSTTAPAPAAWSAPSSRPTRRRTATRCWWSRW